MSQPVQFETEEPALRCFTKARSLFSHQAHTSMPKLVAQSNRFRTNQIKGHALVTGAGRLQQQSDVNRELVQAPHPLGIRRQARESSLKVGAHQAIGLLQDRHLQRALQERNGENFRVSKAWLRVRRTPPLRALRMGFEVVTNKAVDFCHLMFYAHRHRSSSFGRRSRFAISCDRPLKDWRPFLFNSSLGLN